ncbi:VOC family protein [Anaerolineales bacterium]
MQKIVPCLWFDGQVQEAIDFYSAIFKDFQLKDVSYYNEAMPDKAGQILVATLELAGQELMILNGGNDFKLNPAMSLIIYCEDQTEVDYFWEKLTEGGEESQCGWLIDNFGVSWQIIPREMNTLLAHSDAEKAQRVMQALFTMSKIDMNILRNA